MTRVVQDVIRHKYRTAKQIQAMTGLRLYEVVQILAELHPMVMVVGSEWAYKLRRPE